MQVVEKSAEGLSRVIAVTIPASELNAKLDAKAAEVAPQMKLKGFRPGKVPVSHVRKTYGRDLMGEIVNDALNQSSQKALDDAKLRPAAPAEMKLVSDMDKVVAGQEDLSYEMALEVMPDFKPVDPKSLKLTRPVYEAADSDLDEALKELAGQAKTYEDKGGKAPKAAEGDQLTIDFVGKIDGEAFEGGSAEDADLIIGSNRFIPGFEEQLTGAKVGDEKTIEVTFPEQYQAAHLAGKAATFDVTVKALKAPKDSAIDDEFAKRLGLESLDKLKELLRDNLNQQYKGAARFKLKRALLDQLDEQHSFDLPPKMVEAEFDGIWQQVEADKEAGRLPEADAKKSEKKLKEEYRKIAERRVRLGLVLAEIGRENNVTVTDQELNNAIIAEARNYPGQEQAVLNFYRQNPNAAAGMRAPIYEEKVCDLIFDQAEVKEEPISKEDLLKDDEE
ncbi:trigger factor [Brevundimonas sp. BAL450]|jgi:trigger factor|uniref:Trigger factor n=1 Tax=Brevundimonas abyssalis TAR-001 TaxID=1391729 RepID=A0A8E0TRY5_9CAUL|nr:MULTISPECIES: trigger factor [Brevundimonas]MBG7615055.1 trigger factor [Brevundimonas sp. BAL450]GAD59992.1 cell division trigger factor [Brevundimonas abyssalis TAR-001]